MERLRVCVGSTTAGWDGSKRGDRAKFLEKLGVDIHVRGDISSADAVNLHVVLTPFVAERLGELSDGAFGGRVRGDGQPTLEGKKRGEVNDFPAPKGDHVPTGCLREQPYRF